MDIINELIKIRRGFISFICDYEKANIIRCVSRKSYAIFDIDGAEIQGKEELFKKIRERMEIPDPIASNWNALSDCLKEYRLPSKMSRITYVMFINNAKEIMHNNPDIIFPFISAWQRAADFRFNERDYPMAPIHLVFVLKD